MILRIHIPTSRFLECEVEKILTEGPEGVFCIKPGHVDYATVLVPGLLHYWTLEGEEQYVAVHEGVLVKSGTEVQVSTRQAVAGSELGTLQQLVDEQFQEQREDDKQVRTALASLEANFVKQMMDLEQR